jgi:hypothetical protein
VVKEDLSASEQEVVAGPFETAISFTLNEKRGLWTLTHGVSSSFLLLENRTLAR